MSSNNNTTTTRDNYTDSNNNGTAVADSLEDVLAYASAWHIVHITFLCGFLTVLIIAWYLFAKRRHLDPLKQRNPILVLACNAFVILNLVCSLLLRASPDLQPCWLNNIFWSFTDDLIFAVTAYRVFDLVFHYNLQWLQYHEGLARRRLDNNRQRNDSNNDVAVAAVVSPTTAAGTSSLPSWRGALSSSSRVAPMPTPSAAAPMASVGLRPAAAWTAAAAAATTVPIAATRPFAFGSSPPMLLQQQPLVINFWMKHRAWRGSAGFRAAFVVMGLIWACVLLWGSVSVATPPSSIATVCLWPDEFNYVFVLCCAVWLFIIMVGMNALKTLLNDSFGISAELRDNIKIVMAYIVLDIVITIVFAMVTSPPAKVAWQQIQPMIGDWIMFAGSARALAVPLYTSYQKSPQDRSFSLLDPLSSDPSSSSAVSKQANVSTPLAVFSRGASPGVAAQVQTLKYASAAIPAAILESKKPIRPLSSAADGVSNKNSSDDNKAITIVIVADEARDDAKKMGATSVAVPTTATVISIKDNSSNDNKKQTKKKIKNTDTKAIVQTIVYLSYINTDVFYELTRHLIHEFSMENWTFLCKVDLEFRPLVADEYAKQQADWSARSDMRLLDEEAGSKSVKDASSAAIHMPPKVRDLALELYRNHVVAELNLSDGVVKSLAAKLGVANTNGHGIQQQQLSTLTKQAPISAPPSSSRGEFSSPHSPVVGPRSSAAEYTILKNEATGLKSAPAPTNTSMQMEPQQESTKSTSSPLAFGQKRSATSPDIARTGGWMSSAQVAAPATPPFEALTPVSSAAATPPPVTLAVATTSTTIPQLFQIPMVPSLKQAKGGGVGEVTRIAPAVAPPAPWMVLFDAAYDEVVGLLSRDTFPRFVNTERGRTCKQLAELGLRQKPLDPKLAALAALSGSK